MEENEEVEDAKRDASPIITVKNDATTKSEWDLLTMEQVNRIGDPKLRAEILEYKMSRQKEKESNPPRIRARTVERFRARIRVVPIHNGKL